MPAATCDDGAGALGFAGVPVLRRFLRAFAAAAIALACWPPVASGRDGNAPSRPPREVCRLLDDPEVRPLMDGVLNHLLPACGREHELGLVAQSPAVEPVPAHEGAGGPDTLVNDPAGDSGVSQTQSETSLARNDLTGTLCAGYNDSFHRVQGNGVTGFSRSIDGGLTFTDQGALDPESDGDPSLVWRRADGHFYFATLAGGGVSLWRSTDECLTFTPVGPVHGGTSDDKELMAVDNVGSSPFFGRLYVVWTDFGAGGIRAAASGDGGETWSSPVRVSPPNTSAQGAWPVVAPDGELYVAWTRFAMGRVSIEAACSPDGGRSFVPLAPAMVDQVRPEDPAATSDCARSALNGHIRYAPFPELGVGPDGALHVVYSYDPDGTGTGDTVDVFYRRSADRGASWGPELRLNDDTTLADQFFPTLSVGESNVVSASWYDRRLDPANLLIDHYRRLSQDGGLTWGPSERVSDFSTPVYLDPAMATCYHSDYDTHLQDSERALVQWSDDRNLHGGHHDPDVFMDPQPLSDDFLVVPEPWTAPVCAPDDAGFLIAVQQFGGFAEPVALAVESLPPGMTAAFVPESVVPPGSSGLTVAGTASSPAGSYPLTVSGSSSPSGRVHVASVTLELFNAVPPPPAHAEPPDGAVDVDVRATLRWSAADQAVTYLVEIATDPGFSDVVYSATTAETTHRLGQPLAPEHGYHWRVRGENVCGNGDWSAAWSFSTREVPSLLLVDDDDNQPDVRAFYEGALAGLGKAWDVWDTDNSDIEPTAADLALYRDVIWFAGDEYGGAAGPGAEGAAAIAARLDAGGACVLVSGQDILWDRGVTPLLESFFGIAAVEDDTRQLTVSGQGSIFGGLGPHTLDYPFYNYSDTLTPGHGAEAAFVGDKGVAAVARAAAGYRTAFLGFPVEAIADAGDRQLVLARFLEACAVLFADGFESGDAGAWSRVLP
ncbi:MAG TPA: sialidase family protein [Thermoanaerobaculales bacterium]|nr:sialidase family protein [Thermoanaerobaculales bacterium]HQP43923.1 sialidase family protein [Thermoanaerobaculales bacterium]